MVRLGWAVAVFTVITVTGLGEWAANGFRFEREGTVSYGDCREQVAAKRTDGMFSTFTCNTQTTKAGSSMGGLCVRVRTADNGTCTQALLYLKPPAIRCPDSKPYLGRDDRCYEGSSEGPGAVWAGSPEKNPNPFR